MGVLDDLRSALANDATSEGATGRELLRRLTALESTARALLAAIDEAAWLAPCHSVGMHGQHGPECLCDQQRTAVGGAVMEALGIEPASLPRRLHPAECSWCHRIPGQEQYRDRLRQTWDWAGVENTPELAEPAPDAPHPDDPFWPLAHIVATQPVDADGWRNQFHMSSHHEHPTNAPDFLRRGDRFSRRQRTGRRRAGRAPVHRIHRPRPPDRRRLGRCLVTFAVTNWSGVLFLFGWVPATPFMAALGVWAINRRNPAEGERR